MFVSALYPPSECNLRFLQFAHKLFNRTLTMEWEIGDAFNGTGRELLNLLRRRVALYANNARLARSADLSVRYIYTLQQYAQETASTGLFSGETTSYTVQWQVPIFGLIETHFDWFIA